jgi:hypothetical protein
MSNSINATDVNLVKTTISALGSSSNPARLSGNTGNIPAKAVRSHLPDRVIPDNE